METSSNSKTPLEYLQTSGKQLLRCIVNFSLFIWTGIKWLFTHCPNCTWGVISCFILIGWYVHIYTVRAERDNYSYENAVLIDSISRITLQRDSYFNMNNTPVSVIRVKRDSVK